MRTRTRLTASVNGRGRSEPVKKPAFDLALETRMLLEAEEAFALKHGALGSRAYLSAACRFRARIHTIEELETARAADARRRAQAARSGKAPVAVPDQRPRGARYGRSGMP
jgi:hypothetical protein